MPSSSDGDQVVIVVLGLTGVGKSTFISRCCDQKIEKDYNFQVYTSDIRMQGSATKNLLQFKKLCGDALENVRLTTTMWHQETPGEAQKQEDQLKNTLEFRGWMMSKKSKTYRVLGRQANYRIGLVRNHLHPILKTEEYPFPAFKMIRHRARIRAR